MLAVNHIIILIKEMSAGRSINTRRSNSIPFVPCAREFMEKAEGSLNSEQLNILYEILVGYERNNYCIYREIFGRFVYP